MSALALLRQTIAGRFSPVATQQSFPLHIVVVYDFTNPASRSSALAPAQLNNWAKFLSWTPRLKIHAICLGPIARELKARAYTARAELHITPSSPPVIEGLAFSNKLRTLELIGSGAIGEKDRIVLIDHDVFFFEEPRYLETLPADALCAKLDPLRRVANSDWSAVEEQVSTSGILGRFAPPFHLTSDDEAAAVPVSHRLYFNGGVVVLPQGRAAHVFLSEWRRILKAIKSKQISAPAIGDSDQFAFSVAAAKQRIVRLDAMHNYQANNILEGYRPLEIEAVHFSGNSGRTLPEVINAFLENMMHISMQLTNKAHAAYFCDLSGAIYRYALARLCGFPT